MVMVCVCVCVLSTDSVWWFTPMSDLTHPIPSPALYTIL